MIDDPPSLKAATIGRCGSRVREEYARAPADFTADWPALDAVTLKILRSCQATLVTGQHLIDRELRRGPQNNDRAHAPAWARIPAASAPGREASKARTPTLERRSHQTAHADYATCIDGQWYRLSKKQKSRDYSQDDGFKSNLMIYMSLLKARKAVHPGLSRTHQHATSQNSRKSLLSITVNP